MKKLLYACLCLLLCALCALPAQAADLGELAVRAPDGWQDGDTLPTLAMTFLPLMDETPPEWFNQSGEPAYENWCRIPDKRQDAFTFPDGAQLVLDVMGCLHYTDNHERTLLLQALTTWPVSWGRDGLEPMPTLQGEPLACGTLAEASALVEGLCAKLGMELVPTLQLDVSVQRLHDAAIIMNEHIRTGAMQWSSYENGVDENGFTADDECFYLEYGVQVGGVPIAQDGYLYHGKESGGVSGTQIRALVGKGGLRELSVTCGLRLSGERIKNGPLVTAQQALEAFERDSEAPGREEYAGVSALELCYLPVPGAKKSDGYQLHPCWRVEWRLDYGDGGSYAASTIVSATDGEVISE